MKIYQDNKTKKIRIIGHSIKIDATLNEQLRMFENLGYTIVYIITK